MTSRLAPDELDLLCAWADTRWRETRGAATAADADAAWRAYADARRRQAGTDKKGGVRRTAAGRKPSGRPPRS